jgi:hypothetical protein
MVYVYFQSNIITVFTCVVPLPMQYPHPNFIGLKKIMALKNPKLRILKILHCLMLSTVIFYGLSM